MERISKIFAVLLLGTTTLLGCSKGSDEPKLPTATHDVYVCGCDNGAIYWENGQTHYLTNDDSHAESVFVK